MTGESRFLTLGSTGSEVSDLHADLLDLSYEIAHEELVTAHFGASTRKAVLDFQRQRELEPTGIADEITRKRLALEAAEREPRYRVVGRVLYADGTAAQAFTVLAFDRDLRRESLLGETRTNETGVYEITYTRDRFARAEKRSADLLIRVLDEQQTLYETPIEEITFNAPRLALLNATLKVPESRPISEFERIEQEIRPLLEHITVEELREDSEHRDITFLAAETSIEAYKLAHFAVAHKLAAAFPIRPAVAYALFAEGTLLRIDPMKATGFRFEIDLNTELQPLFYDVVLLPKETVHADVKHAVATNIVPDTILDTLDSQLAELERFRDEAQMYVQEQRPRALLNSVLGFVESGKFEQLSRILRGGVTKDAPLLLEDLIAALRPNERAAGEARTRAALGEVFAYNELLIDAARRLHDIEDPAHVNRLARLDVGELKHVVREAATQRSGAPPLREELLEIHAENLARALERRFPTSAFIGHLERDSSAFGRQRRELLALADEPDFDLAKVNLTVAFKSRARPLEPETMATLKATQRVFRIAPTFRHCKALMSAGVNSAASIHAMGEARFMRQFSETGVFSREEAQLAFQKATNLHIASGLLAGELQALSGAQNIAALAGPLPPQKLDAVTADFPNMKSLFQLADYCICEECRTVHSAAAYLVDVLQFLKNRLVVDTTVSTPVSTKIAKDVLFARRPDLGDLDLSCDNTNIPLPYIDVVCELLEDAVAPNPGASFNGAVSTGAVSPALLATLQGLGFPFTEHAVVSDADLAGNRVVRDERVVCKLSPDGSGGWLIRQLRQTYGTAEELAAAPYYRNDAAYTRLAAAKFAFSLPFDLFHQETRSYFEQLGIERADLMSALRNASGPQDEEIAAEALGITDAERQLICTADPANQNTYWNTGTTPAADVMKVVDTFVTRTGLTYAQVEQLLALEWVNPGGVLFIRHLDETCDLTKKEIQNLDAPALDRIHRFLRLWKKAGWTMEALDRVIRAPLLGNGTLDDTCLVLVQQITQLVAQLRLSADEVCTFYDLLPDAGEKSRYAQIYLNATANGRIESDFEPDKVRQNEQDESLTPGSGKKLAAYLDYLALCLGITVEDAGRLTESLGTGAILSRANLAALHSLRQLAHVLRLSIAELLALQSLTTIDVLAAPAETRLFIEKLATVRAAGIAPADLVYLLNHEAENLNARAFSDEAITNTLQRLQAEYQAAFTQTRPTFNPAATADENKGELKTLLSRLPQFTQAALSRFELIVDDAWADPLQTPAAFIDEMLAGMLDTTAIKAAQATLAGAPPPKEAERNAFIQTVMFAVAAALYETTKSDALLPVISQTFRLDEDIARVLLDQARLRQPATAGNALLGDLLLTDSLIDTVNTPPVPPVITSAAFENQFRALRLLHKMNLLLGTLKLQPDGLSWMLANNGALGWMALDDLAYEPGITPVPFSAWEQLQQALSLFRAYPPVSNESDPARPFTVQGLFDLVQIPTTTTGDLLAYLARLTGWSETTLVDLDAHFALTTAGLGLYRLPSTYQRLEKAVTLLRQTALDVASGVAVCKPSLTAADAMTMRLALKSRYAESDWLGVLRNVQDRLREQKRDALVAFLLAINPGLKSSADLYDHFLIDVEMCSCMPTSRIVQAHATVQLFVQRCLMGLEPRSVANVRHDSGWNEWKWMANFRVWEANRKIFLWPENWIDPRLLDTKSQLFTALEDTLQQNEITDHTVETALLNYLDGLDEIAQLEVMAAHYQTDTSTMHVFARTRGGDPAQYFYRQFRKERAWTPWEKIDLDISGDHLLAFERNTRLTIAWPIFSEENDPNQEITIPKNGGGNTEKLRKIRKIQLALSERAGSKWLPRKVSREALLSPSNYDVTLPSLEEYNFFVWPFGGSQLIACTHNGNWVGSFNLTGCKGYPEAIQGGNGSLWLLPQFKDATYQGSRFRELGKDATDDLAIRTLFNSGGYDTIVNNTPGVFRVTYPMQVSLLDWVLLILQLAVLSAAGDNYMLRRRGIQLQLGTYMPYFYGDWYRTYVIVPGYFDLSAEDARKRTEKTFSDIHQLVADVLALLTKYLVAYQQNPGQLTQLQQQLAADPEYLRLQAEYAVYSKLTAGLEFRNLYHPLVCLFKATVNRGGIPALMARDLQLWDTGFDFKTTYAPTPMVVPPYPREDVDFEPDGAYSSYNWELFYHIPFEIALRLNQDQRYSEARDWFHYIFNPVGATDAPAPQKFWNTKPFFLKTPAEYLEERIDKLMYAVAADPSGATITHLKFAIGEWRANPFNPHVVARSRPVAYQIAVVIQYIRNLIDWGEHLFRAFTPESVTQATQMYILAEKLGPRLRLVPKALPTPIATYNEIESKIDLFGNALLDLENLVPDPSLLPKGGAELPPAPLTLSSLYFCVPPNEKLLQYQNLIADRLYKIRHCQNIDGVESILALFAPPIDPGALVRAAAAGLDISSFITSLGAPLPNHRFDVLKTKATELIQLVGSLGNALLQALERRDAEDLARLRSQQELAVLNAVRAVKVAAIAEAEGVLQGLEKSRLIAAERRRYYSELEYMNAWEITATALSGVALFADIAGQIAHALSGTVKLMPQYTVGVAGFGGSPVATMSMGGQNVGGAAESAANALATVARIADRGGAMAATQGAYQRRQDEWDFQVRLADRELAYIDQQIATARLRIEMLTKDLAAHDTSIANSVATEAYLRSKFTNKELYDWMVAQASAVYFNAYKLAFDVAKKCERCFQHELGSTETFLKFGYWDSLRKGLASADALLHDLKQMEIAYLDQHKREYELTRHISLAQLAPAALIRLKATGKCIVHIPESLFDMDHPGHYMRRHKSVSISIPCVVGPYTSVSCKLSLINNRYRKSTALRQGAATDKDKYVEQPGNDDRFVYQVGTIQSIATSTGHADSGLFELNFRDERYLPFEGTGTIATWMIELPSVFRQFDYNTISDVVLHIKYTARDGGAGFRNLVESVQREMLNEMFTVASHQGLFLALDIRQQAPNEWARLKSTQSAQLTIGPQHLPYVFQQHSPTIDEVRWYARVAGNPAVYTMSVDGVAFNLNRDPNLDRLCVGTSNPVTLGTPFTLSAADTSSLESLVAVAHYTIAT